MTDVRFIQMTSSTSNLMQYLGLVCKGMHSLDVETLPDLSRKLNDGSNRAWWAVISTNIVGWCLLAPNNNRIAEHAGHLGGGWVNPNYRNRGIGQQLWQYRIAQVPHNRPVSVSIQPDNKASTALATKLGFKHIDYVYPWNNLLLNR